MRPDMRARIGRALPRSAELKPAERGCAGGCLRCRSACCSSSPPPTRCSASAAPPATAVIRDWVGSAIGILVAAIVCLRPLRIHICRAVLHPGRRGRHRLLRRQRPVDHLAVARGQRQPCRRSLTSCGWLLSAAWPRASSASPASAAATGRPPGCGSTASWPAAGSPPSGPPSSSPASSRAHGSAATLAMELTYPIGDLLLVGLVVGIIALRSWRIDRGWAGLGAAFVLLAAADFLYAIQGTGTAGRPSAVANLTYLLALSALAFVAWQVAAEPPRAQVRLVVGAARAQRFHVRRAGAAAHRPPAPAQRAAVRPGHRHHARRDRPHGGGLPRRARPRRGAAAGGHRRPHGAAQPAPLHGPHGAGDRRQRGVGRERWRC